jgi:hypothetical protein
MNTANPIARKLDGVREAALELLTYCRVNNWEGYDPYDALNSRVFRALPFLNFKAARLALTQGVKRCPINLRPLLLVPKAPNPKGISLFLSSLVKLSTTGTVDGETSIGMMAEKLLALRSPGKRFSSWGYNFDWQTRTYLVPKGTPNIICSTFAANALIDVYEHSNDPAYLETAMTTADFILNNLFWRDGAIKACFNYTTLERTEIHNANLLGAAFLCRVSKLTGEQRFLDPAFDAARYSVGKQRQDGAWYYGESPTQQWIDNFHTGFNLVALRRISRDCETKEFDNSMLHGFAFFREHFFRSDGAPRYFHNSVYPIDIHSISQSILTLCAFRDYPKRNVDLALRVFQWAMANMWDSHGFFYFQKFPLYTVRTPFMRWSQAWMLYALSALLEAANDTR